MTLDCQQTETSEGTWTTCSSGGFLGRFFKSRRYLMARIKQEIYVKHCDIEEEIRKDVSTSSAFYPNRHGRPDDDNHDIFDNNFSNHSRW
jgi:hypothetical protein